MNKPFFSKEPYQVVFVGLDNAGKTTLINHATDGKSLAMYTPTTGFGSREFFYAVDRGMCCKKQYHFYFIDLGGQERIRGIWADYYPTSVAICFVFDASDKQRTAELQEVFADILSNYRREGMPMLIVANKQDLNCWITNQSDFEQSFGSVFKSSKIKFTTATASDEMKSSEYLMLDLGWLLDSSIRDYANVNRVKSNMNESDNTRERLTLSQQLDRMDAIKRRNDEIDKNLAARKQSATALVYYVTDQ